MPTYIPSNSASDIKSSAYVRQNPWKKISGSILENVKISKKLHMPWGHTRDYVEHMKTKPETTYYSEGNNFREIFHKLPVGAIVLVPDGKGGVLLEIVSETIAGIDTTFCVACTHRKCGHDNITPGYKCEDCSSSVQEVFNSSNIEKLLEHLKNGHNIEPFWTPYRHVKIVGDVDYNGVDGRSMAGMDSAGMWEKFWKLK
jgi:hypothetical protein